MKFSYRPAGLAVAQTFRLKDGVLSCVGDEGVIWKLPLSEVTRAGLVDQTTKGARLTRLDLDQGAIRRSISLNHPAEGWRSNPDAQQFVALIRAVGEALEAVQPQAYVTLGEHGRKRLSGFVIGILSGLAGVAIMVMAFVTGVEDNKLITALIPVAVLLIFAIFTTRANWPWTKLPIVPIAEFPKVVDFLERSGKD